MAEPDVSYDVETHTRESHKTGHSWVDMVVAFSALAVSVISLGVAIFHGRTMEEMAKANARLVQANSWPFLHANSSNQDDAGRPEFSLALANAGVGPAKVHWLEIYYRGRPPRHVSALEQACCEKAGTAEPVGPVSFSTSLVDNTVLRAGESTKVLALMRTDRNAPLWDRLNVERFSMSYRACYCSVFDECWIGDLRSLTPQPVRTCPTPAAPFDPMPN